MMLSKEKLMCYKGFWYRVTVEHKHTHTHQKASKEALEWDK